MFRTVDSDVAFPRLEATILEFWREHHTFEKSIAIRDGAEHFVFYDGPPFATGLPHYGHLTAGVLKDIVPRYWTMRGYRVERRFGWDCHGIPVENEVEKDLGLNSKRDIEAYGVANFNEVCRSTVLRYTKEWRETVERLGRWVDFDHDYKTMEPWYMESVWWVFRQLWDKGLIYLGHSVQPYCPRCATPLSNFEANSAYQDVQDPSITIRLPVQDEPDTFFLVWTTTPWTLPSNLGLAVGADIDYVKIRRGDEHFWLAEARLGAYDEAGDAAVVERVKGAELVGHRYTPPFDYFTSLSTDTFVVVAADFVSTEDGSGIVHMAPAFGEDDQAVGKAHGWPVVLPLDAECRFTDEVSDFAGQYVKDADRAIMKDLDARGFLHDRATVDHAYPHCWRCESPLIYRGIPSWFCKIEPIKARMLANNATINWVPEHIRDGRFGSWLENAHDWNLSRNRYWGAPLPIWTSEDGEETVCVGSREELERLSGQTVTDLHKHFVDEITIPSQTGRGELRRVPQVMDCWFESGSMPYAQIHYPFENADRLDTMLPGDFIAEGLDQTRGWFYTLLILSTALFDRPPFRNVIVNGMLLAEDGKKMSKRLKNYPDPVHILDEYGADALRAYLINSPAVKAETLRFSENGVREVLRKVMLPLWNAYSFFVTYANIDGWTPTAASTSVPVTHQLDRWVLSSLQTLIADVNTHMDRYQLHRVVPRLDGFIDDLTNWYIRRSRQRFWSDDDPADKASAYRTLYDVLVTYAKVLAPVLPFVCEEIYRNLTVEAGVDGPESVHLCDYPRADDARRDETLEREMSLARTIVDLGRTLRSRHNLKIRQPLSDITVVARTEQDRDLIRLMEPIILDELNVKALAFTDREEELVELHPKANFRVLGKRLGPRMKEAAAAIAELDLASLRALEEGRTIEVCGEAITLEDILIDRTEHDGHVTETGNGVTVSLNTQLSEALLAEGLAREMKNRIQSMRKAAGFDVTDRIRTRISSSDAVQATLQTYADYLERETLTTELTFGREDESCDVCKDWDVGGERIWVGLSRVT